MLGPDYLAAFERNCPGVRMTLEERLELVRLFNLALRQTPKLRNPLEWRAAEHADRP